MSQKGVEDARRGEGVSCLRGGNGEEESVGTVT